MNRRNFLKGIATLAGIATVPAIACPPPVEEVVVAVDPAGKDSSSVVLVKADYLTDPDAWYIVGEHTIETEYHGSNPFQR